MAFGASISGAQEYTQLLQMLYPVPDARAIGRVQKEVQIQLEYSLPKEHRRILTRRKIATHSMSRGNYSTSIGVPFLVGKSPGGVRQKVLLSERGATTSSSLATEGIDEEFIPVAKLALVDSELAPEPCEERPCH